MSSCSIIVFIVLLELETTIKRLGLEEKK